MENLTAVWFLLRASWLFATALAERNRLRVGVYALGSVLMVFAAGEETSWGQCIFGFATPNFLIALNNQGEASIHNISPRTFTKLYGNGALILCVTTCAALFARKDALFGIPLPPILLMLGWLLMVSVCPIGGSLSGPIEVLNFM